MLVFLGILTGSIVACLALKLVARIAVRDVEGYDY